LTERTRVVVAAESALEAARIEAMLAGDPSLDVAVSSAATVAAEDRPGIVVLAMSPPLAGRLIETLRALPRAPAIVLLTRAPHEAWTARARRSGVHAVLPLRVTAEELRAAVAATKAGLVVLHRDVLGRAPSPAFVAEANTLTPRELEILEMMADGLSNRAIAARLKISRHTVKFHVASILTRLGARTRAEAVSVGVRRGVLSL
jgi:two-component system, NarL family, response regulator YdfI